MQQKPAKPDRKTFQFPTGTFGISTSINKNWILLYLLVPWEENPINYLLLNITKKSLVRACFGISFTWLIMLTDIAWKIEVIFINPSMLLYIDISRVTDNACRLTQYFWAEGQLKPIVYLCYNQWCSGTHAISYGVWATLYAATCRLYDPII